MMLAPDWIQGEGETMVDDTVAAMSDYRVMLANIRNWGHSPGMLGGTTIIPLVRDFADDTPVALDLAEAAARHYEWHTGAPVNPIQVIHLPGRPGRAGNEAVSYTRKMVVIALYLLWGYGTPVIRQRMIKADHSSLREMIDTGLHLAGYVPNFGRALVSFMNELAMQLTGDESWRAAYLLTSFEHAGQRLTELAFHQNSKHRTTTILPVLRKTELPSFSYVRCLFTSPEEPS